MAPQSSWNEREMKLRAALTVISLLVTVLGSIACISGYHAFPIAIWSGIIFVLLLIERWRYNTMSQARGKDDIATGERFIDPETGAVTEVVYNQKTGKRKYLSVPGKYSGKA